MGDMIYLYGMLLKTCLTAKTLQKKRTHCGKIHNEQLHGRKMPHLIMIDILEMVMEDSYDLFGYMQHKAGCSHALAYILPTTNYKLLKL